MLKCSNSIIRLLVVATVLCTGCSGIQPLLDRRNESTENSIASTSPALDEAELEQTEQDPLVIDQLVEVLEYSEKNVDPTSLVQCNDREAEIESLDEIDLSRLGDQEVSFRASNGERRITETFVFTVRDTKRPSIQQSSPTFSVDQGGSFDPWSVVDYVRDPVDGDLAPVLEEPAKRDDGGDGAAYDAGWYTIEGTVDTSTPATYYVTIKASDQHGNTASKEIPVVVNEVVREQPVEQVPETHTYILNTNTKKFHNPYCNDIKRMKESNKQEITATRDEVLSMGYESCGHCTP